MASTITLKNIPDSIYSRLKEEAAAHHRSLNSEIIACLERTLLPSRVSPEDKIARARELRGKLAGRRFRVSEITRAIDRTRT